MKKFLTLEQMISIRNFGIDVAPKDTGMIYSAVGGEYKLMYSEPVCEDDIKAFDLQDVIELLPQIIFDNYLILELYEADFCYCKYENDRFNYLAVVSFFEIENILEGAYKMLIWVIENGHLKTK